MSKKRKKKPSRKARKGQPQGVPAAASVDPSLAAPQSQTAPPAEPAAPAAPAPQTSVTATFRPAEPVTQSAAAIATDAEADEYTSVRKDLRKLGITIVGFVLVIIGLAALNAQTDFIGSLGEQMFRLWE